MSYHYCTCKVEKTKATDEGRTPIRAVEVDSEGICKDCGYYAVSTSQEVKDRTELYKLLRLE